MYFFGKTTTFTNPQITIFIGWYGYHSQLGGQNDRVLPMFYVPIPWRPPEAQEEDGVVGGSAQACESHDEN